LCVPRVRSATLGFAVERRWRRKLRRNLVVMSEESQQLAEKRPPLTALATDWRKLLFPEANDEQFADGYAQAVTFGLLMARSSDIRLADGLDQVGKQLGKTNSLIGVALRLLTDEVGNESTLKTSLGALLRVLDAMNRHDYKKVVRRMARPEGVTIDI